MYTHTHTHQHHNHHDTDNTIPFAQLAKNEIEKKSTSKLLKKKETIS